MATGGGGSISLSSEPFYDFSCSNCAKDEKHTEGERFCVECNEIFCTSCLAFHNKIAIMRQHELLDQTNMATRRPQRELVQLPTSRCTVHQDQLINMYCGQDDLVCCTICIAEDHRTCEGVTYIPKAAKDIKTNQEFKDFNAAIDIIRVDMEMLKKGKKLDLVTIMAQHSQIQASIGELRDQINKYLDHLEASIRAELERKFKFHEEEINNTIAELDIHLLEMEKRAAKLKDTHESQLFVDMKEAKMKNKEGLKLIDYADKTIGKAGMHFVPNQEILKTFEIKSYGILNDQISFTSVSHHGDFNIKTKDDKNTCDITGSCQMLDGNILLTDLENEKLKLIDRSYKVVAELKLPGRPTNVCRTSPTEVAIAIPKNKTVLFAKVTDKLSLKGSFNVGDKCRGVAYNEGLLYVSCGGYKKGNECPGQVQVYDMEGQCLQSFIKDKHNKNLFSLPKAIAISPCRKKLHIADRDNGIVTMNLDGTEPCTFTCNDMIGPNGICVVNNDNLIVCGFTSHNVLLFDKKGQQKAILLKENDGLKGPFSVLYDRPNSKLIVSACEINHIKVFNL